MKVDPGGARAGLAIVPVRERRCFYPCQFFAKLAMLAGMSRIDISLPDTLKSFIDEQVASCGYGTSSEYVRELIRKDQNRQQLRRLLTDGAESALGAPADDAYFEGLRAQVCRAA